MNPKIFSEERLKELIALRAKAMRQQDWPCHERINNLIKAYYKGISPGFSATGSGRQVPTQGEAQA